MLIHQPATPQSGKILSEKTIANTEHTLLEDSISGIWKTRTHENAPPRTSGNPEHDGTVEADVVKTASSQAMQRIMVSVPTETLHPGRMAGQMLIYMRTKD